jgi:hypothetical protein
MIQGTPMMPDTVAYYHAAYIAVALLYGGYAVSLWLRARSIRRRLTEHGRADA